MIGAHRKSTYSTELRGLSEEIIFFFNVENFSTLGSTTIFNIMRKNGTKNKLSLRKIRPLRPEPIEQN